MDNIVQRATLIAAAGTAARVYFAPSSLVSGQKLKPKSISMIPNVDTATNGTDYVTVAAYKGASTAITDNQVTSSVGFTAGTAIEMPITGTGTNLEITQASPLSVRVAHSGSGKAVNATVIVEFEVIR